MTKEEIVKYYREHPEDLFDLCEEFDLHYNIDDKKTILNQYHALKVRLSKLKEKAKFNEKIRQGYHNLREYVENMEKKYHIFEPEFDEKMEQRWLPQSYNSNARDVFEYRKQMFRTQRIHEDMLLDNVIADDMGNIDLEKGGQDGMYDAFPFTRSKMDVVDEYDYKSDTEEMHFKVGMIRSYGLSSGGGIAIVETITETTYGKNSYKIPEGTKRYSSTIQIITLGEDDGHHFLNSARLYCEFFGDNSHEKFLNLLEETIKEYESVKGTFKFNTQEND